MLNPCFNLPSYLIGMYFGLINYSIQKGIMFHNKDRHDSYQKLKLYEMIYDDYNNKNKVEVRNEFE